MQLTFNFNTNKIKISLICLLKDLFALNTRSDFCSNHAGYGMYIID